jgi:peptidoglycan hydrolase CwlO-like protein
MSDDYVGHKLEQVLDEIKAVHELVAEVPKMARKLDRVEQDVAELKQDMKVVKAAVTATNHDLKQHKSLPAHVAHGHA